MLDILMYFKYIPVSALQPHPAAARSRRISSQPLSMRADYFDGRSARRQPARVTLAAGDLVIEGDFGRRTARLSEVEIGEPTAGAPRILRLADGAHCEIGDQAELDSALAAAGYRDTAVTRTQRRWHWALGALSVVIALVGLGYWMLLPRAADWAALAMPPGVASALSTHALSRLDDRLLRPSTLPEERRRAIAGALARLETADYPLPPHRLDFRAAPGLGPNAFALPDGTLVLFDELVILLQDDEQIVAVLAHELGHVSNNHGMRQLIQGAVVGFVVGAWFGDVSSIAAGLGALVLESRYSREFEREADAFAARRLTAAGQTPLDLARALARLEAAHAARRAGKEAAAGENEASGLLDSHPDIAERIKALSATAGDAR